ncbi:TlpA family protein disulfide reductase [Chitinophaga filiformis]|uniref:Thiol-disulfide isomerase or thioredoxin n=1 Tax=Chitinophaga filiformis TaxID=104663 RepID=A0A1G7P260_CHIFI|nr:TlpA disulfide reductase family protein [Chitinophaga filiformis]SDF79520.1 Thiol-disulfide isomerase or thioredoxin [Chitinophaga filiformis]
MRKGPFIALLAFAGSLMGNAHAQSEIRVSLKTVIGKGPWTPSLNPTNLYGPGSFNFDSTKTFKGIPSGLTQTMIKELDLQPLQGMYELYKRLGGKMPPDMLVKELNRQHTDTSFLSGMPIKHTVHILSGITADGKRILITDANNNLDFSDDRQLIYDTAAPGMNTKDAEALVPGQDVDYQFAYKGKVYSRKINLQISPYQTAFGYSNPEEQQHYMVAFVNEYREGMAKVGGKEYAITCMTAYHPPFFYDSLNTKIFVRKRSDSAAAIAYNLGDTLLVQDAKYNIAAIDPVGSQIVLKYTGKGSTVVGSEAGQLAYLISCPAIDGQPFALNALRGKYVLLDFWGSWCKPCISAISDLASLNQKYKHILSIVSIAYDEKKNLPVLDKLIKENGMKWTHLFEDNKDKSNSSIINRFKVEAFPTQILIDPEGKIILRIVGVGKSELIENHLKNSCPEGK